MAEPPMPDLSHLTEDERKIIEEVLKRQKAEEDKDAQLSQNADKELDDIDHQISERQKQASLLIGTQDDAICQICQKTKFADGIGHKCYYCQLRSCARCGGRTQLKTQKTETGRPAPSASQNKTIWACSLCQKRQQILAKTGKWFQGAADAKTPTTPVGTSPALPGGGQIVGPDPSVQQPPLQRSPSQQPPPSQMDGVPRGPRPGAPLGSMQTQKPSTSGPRPNTLGQQPRAAAPAGSGGPRMNHVAHNQVAQPPAHQQDMGPRGQMRRQETLPRQTSVTSVEERERTAERMRRQSSDVRVNGRDPRGLPSGHPDLPRKPSVAQDQYRYPPDDRGQQVTPPEHRNDYRYVDAQRPQSRDRTRTPPGGHRPPEFDSAVDSRRRDEDRRTSATYDRPVSPRDRRPRSPQYNRDRDNRTPTSFDQPRDYIDKRDSYSRDRSRDDRYSPSRDYPPDRRPDEREPVPYVNGQRQPPYRDSNEPTEPTYRQDSAREQLPQSTDPYTTRRAESPSRRDRNSGMRRSADHRPEPKSSRNAVGMPPSQRAKLDMTVRTDSLSSETSEQPRGRHRNHRPGSHHHHQQQPGIAKSALLPSTRYKRPKLPRQHRSYSSSDEELPSTSECPSCEEPDLESESFSERGLLRYLYGSQRLKNSVLRKTGDSDVSKKRWKDEEILAAKIKKFLSHPVTWQPSADGRRLIGHMVLHRYSAGAKGDLGLKVVGGRRTELGHLGAFITRVKRGSVADTIGHLRAGDEVLEWNGRKLQNATFEQVYEIISESKHEPQVELIVSRSTASPGGDDFLELKSKGPYRPMPLASVNDTMLPSQLEAMSIQSGVPSGLPVTALPGSIQQGIIATDPTVSLPPASAIPVSVSGAPLVMVTAPPDPMMLAGHLSQQTGLTFAQQIGSMPARGQIFGRIQLSLYFTLNDRQLVVTVHQACDLPPRSDGTPRNPYVKMFLLPDRSEKSRRQSKVLAGTCVPVWQQPFIYQNLTDHDLLGRVLEVTLWDYDKYATNDFLGEVLIELAIVPLNNEPQWYTLTDMDEENPIRAKVRQQRLSAYLGQQQAAALGQPMAFDPYGAYIPYATPMLQDIGRQFSAGSSGYRSDSGIREPMIRVAGLPRSKTYASHRSRHPQAVRQDDYDDEYSVLVGAGFSGYLSDHGYSSRNTSYQIRRPRSATQMRPPRDLRPGSPTETTKDWNKRNLPNVPGDMYGDEAMAELDEKAQMMRDSHGGVRSHHHRRYHGGGSGKKLRNLPMDPSSPGEAQMAAGTTGYVSDGSETSMSVTSTHSERPRRRHMTQYGQEYTNSLEVAPEEEEAYGLGLVDSQDGTMSDSAVGSTVQSTKSAQQKERDRKKSLMTRLIPGRAGQGGLGEQPKRTGFSRSEEVGIPTSMCLSPQTSFDRLQKQASKDSTDSSDSWVPILPDGPLGDFVTDLGPGQVVGRQVLASPVLGQIQLGIASKRGNLEVEIVRARSLVAKTGAKFNPAPYVKVYLMEGKVCVAKAKTTISRRTTEPLFQQQLVFNEPYQGRMLQITVWGDYGRIERKAFMGIAQIRLDDLDLTTPSIGWYKLYHSSSLVGTGSSPARKDSQSSLPEYAQQQQMSQRS